MSKMSVVHLLKWWRPSQKLWLRDPLIAWSEVQQHLR